jgi:hypothetical protein
MQSSPIWALILIAIVLGPFVYAIIYGIRHRDSGSPDDLRSIETNANIQALRNTRDMRTRGTNR